MICFPQLLHFVSQLTNISSIHTRLNIYHRRYNGSKMRHSRSWKSARREISARQVHGTCVHVIPWPGKQDRSARLTYTVARAPFRVAEADSFVSVAGKRRTTGRLRTRDDPWIPTSEWTGKQEKHNGRERMRPRRCPPRRRWHAQHAGMRFISY